MPEQKRRSVTEPFIVLLIVAMLSALLSGYLTFKVQFERRKSPVIKKTRDASYQVFMVKEQERKQIHDHFHRLTEDVNLAAWAEKSSCIACHSPYPHGKNLQAIAVMNLHTEFMTCHSCHLKAQDNEQIRFGWINPTGHESKAEPFGVRIDPKSGTLAKTENHFSKLTPFHKLGDTWSPVTSVDGVKDALDYIERKGDLSEADKNKIVNRLHQGTELKEFVKCNQCHSKNGVIDFKALGFEQTRINQLEKMEISGMLTDYDTFYFPDLFEQKFK